MHAMLAQELNIKEPNYIFFACPYSSSKAWHEIISLGYVSSGKVCLGWVGFLELVIFEKVVLELIKLWKKNLKKFNILRNSAVFIAFTKAWKFRKPSIQNPNRTPGKYISLCYVPLCCLNTTCLNLFHSVVENFKIFIS